MGAQKIIYQSGDGVTVLDPLELGLAMARGDIHKVARKDVPFGAAYQIIDEEDLPDRTFRSAWEVDGSKLTCGVGADTNSFYHTDSSGEVIT